MSLPNGRATLAQMVTTDHEQSLSSNLKITIPGNLNETHITCANNPRVATTKSFILATGKQTTANHGALIPNLVHRPIGVSMAAMSTSSKCSRLSLIWMGL